jgi:hypothetical protein
MGVEASKDWLGVLLVSIGAIIGTIWNLGTRIDVSNPSTTIFNPLFVIGIILMVCGILVIKSNR